ncbi:hypothetical protein FOCC_FOCC008346 [Frankliniella occidentalis]|nr:hypothetical protein FOCC_FOCC008346 [Frankliniella occidentalis]
MGAPHHHCLGHGVHNLISKDGIKGAPLVDDLCKKARANDIRNLNRRVRRVGNANADRLEQLENLRRRVNRDSASSNSQDSSSDSDRSRSSHNEIDNNELEDNELDDNGSEKNNNDPQDSDLENNDFEINDLEMNDVEDNQLENDEFLGSDGSGSHSSGSSNESEISNQQQMNDLFQNEWALEGGVLSMSKLDSLLVICNLIFPNVPKSYKTLLKTPLNFNIVRVNNDELLWYKGIATNLERMQLDDY